MRFMNPKITNNFFYPTDFLLFIPVNKSYGLCYNICHIDLEDKSTGWTRPSCQKEYVNAVHLRPRPTTPLRVTLPRFAPCQS